MLPDLFEADDEVLVVNHQPMADGQAGARQWHLAIVRDDSHGPLVTEPVQNAGMRFQRYLIAVSKSYADTGAFFPAKKLNPLQ